MSDVRFFYLRNRKGFPVVTVATRVTKNAEGKVKSVAYGIATHNPKDPFNRQVGMQVAEGRLNRKPECLNAIGETVAHTVVSDIFNLKMWNSYDYVPQFPERTRKAAKLWLEQHPVD